MPKLKKTKFKPIPAGTIVREARTRAKLTQKDLAHKVKALQNRISAIEASTNVQWSTMSELLHACGFSLALRRVDPTATPTSTKGSPKAKASLRKKSRFAKATPTKRSPSKRRAPTRKQVVQVQVAVPTDLAPVIGTGAPPDNTPVAEA